MDKNHCPTCHAAIPENAPGGFCPACLLRAAEDFPAHSHGAPPLEEIAAAFPRLEVLGLIGHGGMGFVYKVRQPDLDRIVALKILCPELGRDPAFAERFAREARTLGKLHNPNIVTVFEHGKVEQAAGETPEPLYYLLMEYVDGVNLRQAMRAGRFTPEQALAIVPGICDALQAAHAQGIWHRDIKPENILLDREGKVKIADFGIARIVGDPRRDFTLTLTGSALGSAAYMAPEQHEKPHEVDHRADIYSLGVVIYEMLTGELPLGRFPAPSQRAAVDARIDEIVFQTLEKERELRQQSANEVKTDVHRALRPGETRTSQPKPPASRIWGLPKLAFALLLVLLACCAGLAALNLCLMRQTSSAAPEKTQPESSPTVYLEPDARQLQRLEQLVQTGPDILRKKDTLIEAVNHDWVRSVGFILDQTQSEELQDLALSLAATRGNLAMIKMILSQGVDPKSGAVASGLNSAVEAGNAVIVNFLLDAGADPNGKANGEIPKYKTPLLIATNGNRLEIARLLLAKGADVNLMPQRCMYFGNRHQTTFFIGGPLHEAIACGHEEMANLLLDQKADLTLAEPRSKVTPLWLAVWRDGKINPTLIKRLLDMGADPDAESAAPPNPTIETWGDYPGKSAPLERALLAGSVEAMRLMLMAKKKNNTPVNSSLLRDAVSRIQDPDACLEITRLLLDHGADPNPPDPIYENTVKLKQDGYPVSLPNNVCLVELAAKTTVWRGSDNWPLPLIQLLLQRGSKIDPECMKKGLKYMQDSPVKELLKEWSGANAVPPTAPQSPLPRMPSAPPVPPTPIVSVDQVFRKANTAANESNGEGFNSLIMANRTLISDTVAGLGEDVRAYSFDEMKELEFMALFTGEITSLKVVSVASSRVPKRNTFGPVGKFTPVAYATLKKSDGSETRLGVSFRNRDGQWVGTEEWLPQYGAFSRIELKPEKGDAATMLKTHLGYGTHYRAVTDKPGQFDVFGYSVDAELAKADADRLVTELRKSLEKFDHAKHLTVISQAEKPELPYMGENEPPFVPEKP